MNKCMINKMKIILLKRIVTSILVILFIDYPLLKGQDGYKLYTYQVAISQEPISSDSLVLRGTLGSNFYQASNGDTLTVKGGFWNIASSLFSKPPVVEAFLTDTIMNDAMPVIARAIATDMNGIAGANLFIQLGGSLDPVVIPMTALNDTTFEISIPDSLVTVRNLRAHVLGEDNMAYTTQSTFKTPAVEFAKEELAMDGTFSYYPEGLPSEKWRMMAWPGDLANKTIDPSDLESGHVLYEWDPNNNKWNKPSTIEIGRAYWFKHRYKEDVVFKNSGTTGISVPLVNYTIKLRKGWNMIGSPFAFPVSAEYNPETISGLYLYGDPDRDGWQGPSNSLVPWAGYGVHSSADNDSIVLKPFDEQEAAARSVLPGWSLKLFADGQEYFDHTGHLGRSEFAQEGIDGYDTPKLPSINGYIIVALDLDESGRFGYSGDIRSLEETNGVWNLRIAGNNEPGPIVLSGSFLDAVPENLHVAVVDIPRRLIFDDFPETDLSINKNFKMGYDLKLVAGDENYVRETAKKILADIPEEFSLSQNYPNPFNPLTHLDFALPLRSRVEITIYNMLGQEVATLVNRELDYGHHSVSWHGTNRFGKPAASGVYLAKLQTPGVIKTRKMILLK
jgi:hypothetical protein